MTDRKKITVGKTTPIAALVDRLLASKSPRTLVVERVRAAELAILTITTDRLHDVALVNKRRAKDRNRAKLRRDKIRAESADSLDPAQKTLSLSVGGLDSEVRDRKKERVDSQKKTESADSKGRSKMKTDKGHVCPEDFKPKESHYEKAAAHGFSRAWVDGQAERMINWSAANANRQIARKTNWNAALFNFMADKYPGENHGKSEAARNQARSNSGPGGGAGHVRGDARATNHGAIAAGMGGLARKMERQQHQDRGPADAGSSAEHSGADRR